MRELVVQYEPSAREVVAAAYRDFLGALDPDVTVRVVCPDRPAFDDLVSLLGKVRCRLAPIITHHPITTWSRDRWVALAPASPSGATTLWSPRGEAAEGVWPARAGDERVGEDIAAALAPSVQAVRSSLYFDGGDFLSDSENVFVVSRLLPRNIQRTVADRAEFLRALASEVKRRVILLDESPDHHAGMFMASVGGRVMLVGDPHLGKKLLPDGFTNLPGGPDFTPATRHRFDAVAAQCSAAGYRVVRIPVVPARDGRTYLTYVNVLLDRAGDRRIAYLPFYQGAEPLNAAARAVWEELGFEVRPVDCTATYRHFGCLHCLVNVLKRS
jgi:8-oxo-dGTP pyrophosphatase MutT (NUDIX family)